MIDIHCHILPGLDDGPADLEQALRMACDAVEEGVHTVIATPHHADETYENDAETVCQAVLAFNRELMHRGIPLHVLPGQEVRVHAELLDEMIKGKLATLNESAYLLVELPPSRVPPYMNGLLHELRVLGVTPVIAHPERNAELLRQPELLLRWLELGALYQVTAHSLTGLFGKTIQNVALDLCRRNLVHFIASDGHRPNFRPNRLKQAFQFVGQRLGESYVRYYCENAKKVTDGETIEVRPPVQSARRWFTRWNL